MEPRIVERKAFRILGVQIRANPTRADYQDLWHNRYMPRQADIDAVATGHECYGAYFSTVEEGVDDIMAAKAIPEDARVPDGLLARHVPAAAYAVFDCQVQSLGPTWQAIFSEWMPSSGYVFDKGKVALEVYLPGETEDHATAPVEIWLPVRKAG